MVIRVNKEDKGASNAKLSEKLGTNGANLAGDFSALSQSAPRNPLYNIKVDSARGFNSIVTQLPQNPRYQSFE